MSAKQAKLYTYVLRLRPNDQQGAWRHRKETRAQTAGGQSSAPAVSWLDLGIARDIETAHLLTATNESSVFIRTTEEGQKTFDAARIRKEVCAMLRTCHRICQRHQLLTTPAAGCFGAAVSVTVPQDDCHSFTCGCGILSGLVKNRVIIHTVWVQTAKSGCNSWTKSWDRCTAAD